MKTLFVRFGVWALTFIGFFFFLHTQIFAAPELNWTKVVGGSMPDGGTDVTVDTAGNIFMTGYFQDTVDFDNEGTDTPKTSNGVWDIYLTSYDSSGNYRWTKTFGGSSYDHAQKVTADATGNIFVVGHFMTTVDFNPGGAGGSRTATGTGGQDIFVVKFNPDGNFLWVKTLAENIGGPEISIDTDIWNNVILTGNFSGTTNFNPGGEGGSRTSNGGHDIYILKLDSEGNYVWLKTMGGGSTDLGKSIVTDLDGNIYVAGDFRTTVDFNPGGGGGSRTVVGGSGYYDIFITKYSKDGDYAWTSTYGDAKFDQAYGIAIDSDNSLYVTGENRPASGAAPTYIVLLKYLNNGTLSWAKSVGGTQYNTGYAIATDTAKNVFVAGTYSGSVDFDPSETTDSYTSMGLTDSFVTKYNHDGTYAWTYTFGGSDPEYDSGGATGIAVDTSGRLTVTGEISNATGQGIIFNYYDGKPMVTGESPVTENIYLLQISNTLDRSVEAEDMAALLSANVFEADSPTESDQIQVTEKISIIVPDDNYRSEIVLDEDTVITSADGAALNPSLLTASIPAAEQLTNLNPNLVLEGTFQWGIPNWGLQFNPPIRLKIYVGEDLNGQTLQIQRSVSGTSGWTDDGILSPGTCVVVSGFCEFQVTKASYYALLAGEDGGTGNNQPLNSSGGSNGPPGCGDTKPNGTSDLFQIDASATQAIIYFTPINNNDKYFVSFSTNATAEAYGTDINLSDEGVQSMTINHLAPGTTYYFKVRGQNGCMPGDWSTVLKTVTTAKSKQNPVIFYKYPGI